MNRYAMKYATRSSTELMKFLKPIRTVREVAKIMGVSRGTIFFTEKAALNKICVAMKEFAKEEGL